ncbi:hypothetical protein IC575_016660 [Cucumis melo]
MGELICMTLVVVAGNNIGKILQKKATVVFFFTFSKSFNFIRFVCYSFLSFLIASSMVFL